VVEIDVMIGDVGELVGAEQRLPRNDVLALGFTDGKVQITAPDRVRIRRREFDPFGITICYRYA
jgi:hypothetical protein